VFGAGAVWAQTNSVSLVSVSGYGTFHAGGIVATIAGDANGNASAGLEWRPAGAQSFSPGHPLSRVDATRFVGSLFWLTPGTSYDVRVTLTDPDGVTGSPKTAVLATRADSLAEPSLRVLYVATNGDDGNAGTNPNAPLRTVQHAADLAQAGDLILIQPGIYRESVRVAEQGTANQPIVFRGNGAGVILDGADGAIAAGVSWANQGAGRYTRTLGFSTSHVVTEAGRLYQYANVSALVALAAGAPGGFYFDGTTLHLKFADGSSPAAHSMHVARFENGFLLDIDGQDQPTSFVRIENVEIRHYGSQTFGKGVYLRYANDSAVRNCRIHEVEDAGVWIKGGDRNLVEDNEVWDTSIFNWNWDLVKGSSAEDTAIYFSNEIGRGNVVRRNVVHGTFNGIAPCGSLPPGSGFTNETDAYDNVLFQHTDDGFEPEGHCANLRIWNNRIEDVHMAFAVAPAVVGPTYILRNVAYRFGNTRTSQQDGYTASALKINSGYPDPIGPLFLYHNTFFTDAPGTDAMSLMDPGVSTFIRARNNVIAGTRHALEKVNPVSLDWNYDDLYTTDPIRFVRWMGTTYANLAAFRNGTGQEMQGISAAPGLVDPGAGDFTPGPASPLIDKGTVLPGINDSYQGAAPDIGAVESDSPMISIDDVAVAEGNSGTTNAVFTLTLSKASTTTVTVNFATVNGTASAGSDYDVVSGPVSFDPNETTATIFVPVTGDTATENDETFFVNLSGSIGAGIADSQGVGTIANDDVPTVVVDDVAVVEGNAGTASAVFTVSLSVPTTLTVTMNYEAKDDGAIAGSDYEATSGPLTFTPGLTSQQVAVSVLGDTQPEANETFFLDLSGAVNAAIADNRGKGTILDDEAADFHVVTPCRLADTRNPVGPSGGPSLGANTTREFPAAGLCGIPTDAKAVVMNVTVVDETDLGNLRLYPAGTPVPLTSTINFVAGKVRGNNAIVVLGGDGEVAVFCNMVPGSTGSTHLVLDAFGYFQ
jgi:hypothetical protein